MIGNKYVRGEDAGSETIPPERTEWNRQQLAMTDMSMKRLRLVRNASKQAVFANLSSLQNQRECAMINRHCIVLCCSE